MLFRSYERYLAYLGGRFGELETLHQVLALATVEDFTVHLALGPGVEPDSLTEKQLLALGDRGALDRSAQEGSITVRVLDHKGQQVYEKDFSA